MRLKEKQPVIRECCATCGLVVSGGASVSSLTGWIFGKGTCKCAVEVADNKEEQSGAVSENTSCAQVGDRYEVLATVGTGGMGTVYKVKDKNLNTVFALKALRQEFGNDREANKRFQREIDAIKRLDHPNLVSVYDSGRTEKGAPYLVMDYVEGENLASVLKREGPMHPLRFLDIFLQVLEALEHAHEKGIVHRDLKPSNIIISKTESGAEVVKLVDFGIAKLSLHSNKTTQSVTRTGDIFGSPMYMSPEHCEGKRLDQRSDIYSLGCMMYECLTGHTPFSGDNPVKTVLSHLYDSPPAMRRVCHNEVPSELEAVVMKCLNKDVADRYDSASDVISELQLVKEQKQPEVLRKADGRTRRKRLNLTIRKYFPWTLVAACVFFIVSVVPDLPYLLALVDTQKSLNKAEKADAFSKAVLGRSDTYNLPYSYLCSAAMQSIAGNTDRTIDELTKASALFTERGDGGSALMANYFAIAMELNTDKTKDVSQQVKLALKQIDMQSADGPKKGMRVISFLYIPRIVSNQSTYSIKLANDLANFNRVSEADEVWQHVLAKMPKQGYEMYTVKFGYQKYLRTLGREAEAKKVRNELLKSGWFRDELYDECIKARDPLTAITYLEESCKQPERVDSAGSRRAYLVTLQRLRACNSLARLSNADTDAKLRILQALTVPYDFEYYKYGKETKLPKLLFDQHLDTELRDFYQVRLAWVEAAKARNVKVDPLFLADIEQDYATYLFRLNDAEGAARMRGRALGNLSLVRRFSDIRERLSQIGQQALLSNDFSQAESCFLAMVKVDSDAGENLSAEGSDLLRLAAIHVKQGKFAEADQLYERVLADKRNHVRGGAGLYAMLARANVKLAEGDTRTAMYWIESALKGNGADSFYSQDSLIECRGNLMMAEVQASVGNAEEARKSLRAMEAVILSTRLRDQPALYRRAANVWRKLGSHSQSIADEQEVKRCTNLADQRVRQYIDSDSQYESSMDYRHILLGDFDSPDTPRR